MILSVSKKIIVLSILYFIVLPIELPAIALQQQSKEYYWFDIKLGKKPDKKTGTTKLVVKKIGNAVESGSFKSFIQNHKIGLKSGKIAVGPFTEKSQVEMAKMYYRLGSIQNRSTDNNSLSNGNDTTCFYYYTRPSVGKFARMVNFQRIPARVVIGSQSDFLSTLSEGLTFEQLAIGPFVDYGLAEKSKFICRINGEPNLGNNADTLQNAAIVEMGKKWKTVKIELAKLTKKKNSENILYRVKIKFPRKYFVEDAFQTVIFKAKYNDTLLTSSTGLTLQGDLAMDNNPTISFSKGEAFAQTLSFNIYKNAHIKSFIIESLIFNNSKMIEQEPRNVLAK